MSGELNICIGTTGLTVTAVPYLAGVDGTPIALTELDATGVYQGDMTGAAGTYQIVFVASGVTQGAGQIIWDGSAEVTMNSVNVAKINGTAVIGTGITSDKWRG